MENPLKDIKFHLDRPIVYSRDSDIYGLSMNIHYILLPFFIYYIYNKFRIKFISNRIFNVWEPIAAKLYIGHVLLHNKKFNKDFEKKYKKLIEKMKAAKYKYVPEDMLCPYITFTIENAYAAIRDSIRIREKKDWILERTIEYFNKVFEKFDYATFEKVIQMKEIFSSDKNFKIFKEGQYLSNVRRWKAENKEDLVKSWEKVDELNREFTRSIVDKLSVKVMLSKENMDRFIKAFVDANK